jgi:hypothetical protein
MRDNFQAQDNSIPDKEIYPGKQVIIFPVKWHMLVTDMFLP